MEDNKLIYSLLWKEKNEYLTHSDPPETLFSNTAESTIIIVFLMEEEVQECALYEKEGIFRIGIKEGQLYVSCGSREILNSKGTWFSGVILGRYYHIAVLSDRGSVSLWVNGCSVSNGCLLMTDLQSEKPYRIGYGFPGKLKELCVYSRCFSNMELRKSMSYHLDAGNELVYFPFSREITDQGKYHLATSAEGLPFLALAIKAMQFKKGGYAFFPAKACITDRFSVIIPICPKRNMDDRSILFQRSTPDLAEGIRLSLVKQNDHNYKLDIEVFHDQNQASYLSEAIISSDDWTIIGILWNGEDIILLINESVEQTGIKADFPKEDYQCMIGAGFEKDSYLPVCTYTGFIYCVAIYDYAIPEEKLPSVFNSFPNIYEDGLIAYYHAEENYVIEEIFMEKSQLLANAFTCISRIRNLKRKEPDQFIFPETLPREWEALSEENKWRIDWIGGVVSILFDQYFPFFVKDVREQWQRYLSFYRNGLSNSSSFYKITDKFLLTGRSMDAEGVVVFWQELLESGFIGYLKAAVFVSYQNNGVKEKEDLPFAIDMLGDYLQTIVMLSSGQSGWLQAMTEIRCYTLKMMRKRPKNIPDKGIEVRLASIQYAFPGRQGYGSSFIRQNADQAIEPPEWNEDSTDEKPAYAAYIISQTENPSVLVTLKIRFTDNVVREVHMKLLGDDLTNGSLGNIEKSFSVNKTGYAELEIPLSMQVIGKRQNFTPETGGWYFRIQIEEEEYFLQNTYHKIYFCPFGPSEPWVGFEVEKYNSEELLYPWTDALDIILPELNTKIAIWDEAKIMESVAEGVTKWLLQHPAFILDLQKKDAHYSIQDDQTVAFKMEVFLHDEYEKEKKHLINSTDTAMAAASFTNLFGNYLRQALIYSDRPFICNQIVPLGMQRWTDYVYPGEEKGICSHQLAVVWPQCTRFYDASLWLDGGNFPQKRDGEPGADKAKMMVTRIEAAENSEGEVNIIQPYTLKVYKERLLAQGQNYTNMIKITSWGIVRK